MPRDTNVVLIGFMGSGKSSIGRRVARRLGYTFYDTDRLVTERTGLPVAQIFKRLGEAQFRTLEREALASLAHLTRAVVATGGGIVLDPANRDALRALGCVGWLVASEEVTFERVSRNQRRPLLHTENPRAVIAQLLAERETLYKETSHFRIDTTLRSQSQTVSLVISELRHFGEDEPPRHGIKTN